jgi:raffinose/stachyose/melibiose transport system substrate-binding protein
MTHRPTPPFRRLAALATAAGLALSLAACSGDSGTDDNSTSAATGDGGSEAITLTFHAWIPTAIQWEDLKAAFEAEHPDITIEFTREEDYDTYKTNLDNEILAGEVPDLYGMQVGSSFDDYADYALPVSEYASAWLGDLNTAAVEQCQNAAGETMAIPLLTGGMEYYLYNQTLMDEIGITALPTTYDELVAVAQQARDAGYSPFAMGAADAWHDADFFVWLTTQYGDGGDVYKAAAGDLAWDSDNLVAAATAWQKLFTDKVFQDAATTVVTYPNARDDYFLARKAVFFPTGSWHVSAALATSTEVPGSAVEADEIGMAVFPTVGDKDNGVTSGVDFALAISADSSPEKQAAAAEFAEFMAVGEGQQIWVNTLQGFPVSTSISIELGPDEDALAQSSIDLVTETLQESKFARKLVSPTNAGLENDLGVVLQNIADGADPKTELATLNG